MTRNICGVLVPRGGGALNAAVKKAEAAIVLYRGTVVVQGTGPGAVGGFGTTTTMQGGNDPISGGAILIGLLCVAAIAWIASSSNSDRLENVRHQLNEALQDLADSVGTQSTGSVPVPLNFTPNIGAALLKALIAAGAIIVTGAMMSIDYDQMRQMVETFRDEVEANRRLPGRMGCKEEWAKFLQKTTELLAALASPPAAGDQVGAQRILKQFNEWALAANALFMCLGMDPPF